MVDALQRRLARDPCVDDVVVLRDIFLQAFRKWLYGCKGAEELLIAADALILR